MSQQKKKIKIILDSGAFSAWTKKINIDIDEYIDFSLKNLKYLDYIVNLDVIPGEFGKKNTKEDVENSAQKGWKNYEYMILKGIPKEKLIHIFHQDEDFKWLEKIISKMDYIGISPANDRTTKQKMKWLDECMPYIIDKDNKPKVKFHGFAVTSLRLLFRYPWYSVDSTSWVMTGRMGSIFVPKFDYNKNKYMYDQKTYKVDVSSKASTLGSIGKHITNFSKEERNEIQKYLNVNSWKLGKSEFKKVNNKNYELKENEKWDKKKNLSVEIIIEEGLCNSYKLRDEANIKYFLELEKSFPKWPWAFKISKRKGL